VNKVLLPLVFSVLVLSLIGYQEAFAETIPVGIAPIGIGFDSLNNRMYVGHDDVATVYVIRTSDNTVIATIPVGNGGRGVAFDSFNNRMYVTSISLDSVKVIDTSSNTVTDTILVGDGACPNCKSTEGYMR